MVDLIIDIFILHTFTKGIHIEYYCLFSDEKKKKRKERTRPICFKILSIFIQY